MTAPYQDASRLNEYVTFKTSPLTTVRSPGDWKSEAENKRPELPDATLHKNAPEMVALAFIVNVAVEAELLMFDGSASVAFPNVTCGRVPL